MAKIPNEGKTTLATKAAPPFRKKFVAVVGPRKSGKSTIIQAVSGCENRSFDGLVEDTSVRHSVYVIAASPQESGMDEATFRGALARVMSRRDVQGLIAAIQPTHPSRRLPMERMVELARQYGLESHVFVLDPPRNEWRGAPGYEDVRERVLQNDPGARIVRLDGRRFAVLNAEAIRALSRLPY